VVEQPHGQHVAAEGIAYGQGFHAPTIPGSKPTFEIHRPDLVAPPGYGQLPPAQPGTPRRTTAAAPAQLHSLEPLANRAGCWSPVTPILFAQPDSQLPTAPTAMLSSQPPKSAQPQRRGSTRRLARTRAPVSQSATAFPFEARLPLVTIAPTDPEGLTQLRHALLGLQSQLHKLQPSRQRKDLFPRHAPGKGPN
jgi:hypothetical protein